MAKATLLSLICLRYATAYSTNEIANQLLRSGLHPEGAGSCELLDDLIRPILDAFRRGRIPIDNWWDARDLMLVVVPWYARSRLAETEQDVIRRELMERWQLSQDTAEAVIEEARLGEPTVPELLRAPAPDSEFDRLWQRDGVAEALTAEREALSQRPAPNETVADLRDAVARHQAMSARLDDLTRVRPALRSELASAHGALSEAIKNLTVFEAGFIRPRDRGDEVLRAAVDSTRNSIHLSSAGSNAPADGYLDGLMVPDWLTEYCVAVGGRLGHKSCGPIPYWFSVLEGTELPDELSGPEPSPVVSLAINQEPDGLAEVFRVFHMRGEERFGGFTFADDSLDDAIQLALIALCGFIRLDTFLLGSDGLLELINSSRVDVADSPVGQHLRDAALRALSGQRADAAETSGISGFRSSGRTRGPAAFSPATRPRARNCSGLACPSRRSPRLTRRCSPHAAMRGTVSWTCTTSVPVALSRSRTTGRSTRSSSRPWPTTASRVTTSARDAPSPKRRGWPTSWTGSSMQIMPSFISTAVRNISTPSSA